MASAAEQLVDELRRIPGVAHADVEPDSPDGVRVTLRHGADATGVAAAVRDVLSLHGLRPKMVPPRTQLVPDEPPPPPGSASNVLPGPGLVTTTILPPTPEPQPTSEPEGLGIPSQPSDHRPEVSDRVSQPSAEPARTDSLEPGAEMPGPRPVSVPRPVEDVVNTGLPQPAGAPGVRPQEPSADHTVDVASPPSSSTALTSPELPIAPSQPGDAGQQLKPAPGPQVEEDARVGLESVRVEERRGGISVTVVTEDGRSVTKPGRASEEGVNEAVVAAVGEASSVQPAPVLVEVGEAQLGGRSVVTVILQRPDGSVLVGSSVVGAEKAFAVARATWAAINEEG